MSLLAGIVVAVSVPFLCLLGLYYYNYFRVKFRLKTIPNVEQYPVLGSLHKFLRPETLYTNVMTEFPRVYGRTFWLMAGVQPVLFTADPDLVELVLTSPKHVDKPNVVNIIRRITRNGLVGAEGNVWRNHKKVIVPTFRHNALEQFMKTFNKHSDRFVEKLRPPSPNHPTELLSVARQWSLAMASETVLGVDADPDAADCAAYLEGVEEILGLLLRRFVDPVAFFDVTYHLTGGYRREREILRRGDEYVTSAIERRLKELSRRKSAGEAEDEAAAPIDAMFRAVNAGEWTMEDVVGEAHTFLFASSDTTALTVAYTVYNFAEHPDMQEKAYEEVRETLRNDASKEITIELLNGMRYLEMFLKESMRVFTVCGFLPRKLGEEVTWRGLTLPEGLPVIVPVTAVHHDPDLYPDPARTDPERFAPENCAQRHPYSYVPFSAGPRNCVGRKYAALATKTCLAKLLLRYRFASVGHKVKPRVFITVTSKNGVKVGLTPRK